LKLHPKQDQIPDEERLEALEDTTVKIVSEMGVWYKDCIADPLKVKLFEFIPGLGKESAKTFIKNCSKIELLKREFLK
jgi:hypothetical protein